MKTTKINTYLPVFQGFYGTIFEADNEENEIDDINQQREAKGLDPINYDNCEWDYKEYHLNVAKECVNAIESKLQEILNKDVKVIFEELRSPREYNFYNDAIDVEISLNKAAQQTILDILRDNKEKFNEHIKQSYSSRDGFFSSHSNDANEWIENLKTWDNDILSHKLGAVLEFILEQVEEYEAINLYEDIETHWVCTTNYFELIEE